MRRHTVMLTALLLSSAATACSSSTDATPAVSATTLLTATGDPTPPTPGLPPSTTPPSTRPTPAPPSLTPPVATTPAPASPTANPSVDQDARYAAAVRAQTPTLARVSDDNLGVQGRLVCTLLASGDSPMSVYETMQYAYPDAAKAMTTQAPPVYCPKYTSSVNSALRY
ncbi:DUF732 domain-containing protein [Kitasatospora purpeofusca]|uniref:DUF732 domain-containing protein n=1 Tax=Kitasatospora purpeofusca TaxID=67352 RepID=UPI0033C8B86A